MIVLEQVCKSYDGGRAYTVRDVSLRVPQGQVMVLLGGSGCGKTTTLKMINRLLDPNQRPLGSQWSRCAARGSGDVAQGHRLRVSRDRPVSALDHRREHRGGAAVAGVAGEVDGIRRSLLVSAVTCIASGASRATGAYCGQLVGVVQGAKRKRQAKRC